MNYDNYDIFQDGLPSLMMKLCSRISHAWHVLKPSICQICDGTSLPEVEDYGFVPSEEILESFPW